MLLGQKLGRGHQRRLFPRLDGTVECPCCDGGLAGTDVSMHEAVGRLGLREVL